MNNYQMDILEIMSLVNIEKNYKLALEKINILSKKIGKEEHREFYREELWFCSYSKSLTYKKQNNLKKSLKHCKKSCRFIDTDFQANALKTFWLLSNIYLEMLNLENDNFCFRKEKTKRLYTECESLYREYENIEYSLSMRFNIYKIDKDYDNMLETVIELDFLILQNRLKYQTEEFEIYSNFVIEGVIDLLKINKEEQFTVLNLIKNKEIKEKLIKKLITPQW